MTEQSRDVEAGVRGLIDAHGRSVRALLSRREFDFRTVDELWADVFALAAQRLDDLADLPSMAQRSWLIRTANHLTANHSRRAATRRRTLEQLARQPLPFVESAEAEAEQREADRFSVRQSSAIRAALARLAPNERQVLLLNAIGYDGPRIAAELSITQVAARKRLMRARYAFRAVYVEPTEDVELAERDNAER